MNTENGELREDLVWEIIRGQCISKSNGFALQEVEPRLNF